MSLPPAKKDATAHPAKGSVIDPVDKVAKDADVQRKIKLFNALSAMRQSRLPTNAQMDSWLDYAVSNPPLDIHSLSKDGQKLVGDVQEILKTLRALIQEKNADQLIQEWIWATREIDTQGFVGGVKGKAADTVPEKDKVREDANTASQHVRSLVHLVLTNGEFRKLISDFGVVARDLAARGAVKIAEGVRPDEERLRSAATGQPESVQKGKADAEGVKAQAKDEARDLWERDDADTEEAKGKVQGLLDRVKDAIPQGYKDKANGHFSRGKEFLSEEYFPKERRDQVDIPGEEDYQESIKWLLDYVEEYAAHGKSVVAGHAEGVSEGAKDPALTNTIQQLRTILERFSGGKSLSLINDPFDALADDARRDPELRKWFALGRDWLRDILLKAGYILEPASTTAFNNWTEGGKVFYGEDGKYREHFNRLFDGMTEWVKGVGEDAGNRRFASDWAKLTRDLLFAEGEGGGLTFKKELWSDIRKVVVPMLVEKVGYVPIPRIEYTDDAIDLVVENLTLSGRNLFPMSPYASVQDGLEENRHEIQLTFGQMQADMRDVAFYFRKKSGIPKLKDSGLADVVIGGEGLTATAHLVSSKSSDPTSIFTIKKVVVKVDNLKFSIRDSKHDLLYKTLKPLAMGLVKKQIEKAVGDAIHTALEYVDGILVSARDRMEEEKEKEDGKGRMGVISEVIKAKKDSLKDDTSSISRSSSSQFKVVSNKRDSILANQGHPSGWVNRIETNPEEKSDGWKSSLFDLAPSSKQAPRV
ncbi:hypothetical protein BDZ89DRAFT_1137988 [Hymenopellis radicata]|nr:hypothetical protein BDZ89DRAFT_1137988 [Hymenopellis radicata]